MKVKKLADSRTKNASRNFVFGAINQFISLILPFITRTIIIYMLGSEYLGISSMFTSILSFLSLTDLGLGSAIVYTMYKPIAENDSVTICALLHYYRRYYRIIGSVILAISTLLLPFLPYLIKGSLPIGVNIYILYCIFMTNSVISYFFAGYKQSLLTAHQRSDVTSKISIVIQIFVQAGQITALCLIKNFYVYSFVPIIGTIIINSINAYITNRIYPKYCCHGDIDIGIKRAIGSRISGLIGTKLNSTVVNSADTLFISAFLGLTATAMYGNYYYIMNTVSGFILIFYSSMTAGIGNSIATESLEKNFALFHKLSLINAWIVGFCCTCLLCLYQPFMKLWVGKDLMYEFDVVIALVCYFFIYQIQRTVLTFKDAAGIWYEDRFRPYVSMAINLVSNFLLVHVIGIYGVIISTIIAFFISLPWANFVLFRTLFHQPAVKNLLTILAFGIVTATACTVSYFCCMICGDGVIGLIERIGICLVVPNLIQFLFYRRTVSFIHAKETLLSIVRSKLHCT